MYTYSIIIAILVVLVTRRLLQNEACKRLERSHGCERPNRYPHVEPLFGLDAFKEAGEMFTKHNFFPVTLRRFATLGRTFDLILFGERFIYSIEPENIQAVFSSSTEKWGVNGIRLSPIGPYFGRGFLTLDGPEWQRARHHMSHVFHKASPECHRLQDFRSLFELDDKQNPPGRLYGRSTGSDSFAGLGPLKFLYFSPEWKAANVQNHKFFQKYADQALRPEAKPNSRKRKLLLEAMAEEVKDPLQLRNAALHLFVAANETTANLISSMMWALARKPEIWARLRSDVLAIGDVPLDSEIPLRLPYLQNVINETLRLYPVFPWHNREASQDCVLPTGGGPEGKSPIFVRAGDRFEASFLALHRDPKIWGEDSNEFRPERWEEFQAKQWEFYALWSRSKELSWETKSFDGDILCCCSHGP